MDKNAKIAQELNTLLKGEYMAIYGYEKFIQNIEDQKAKSELQKIQKDHKQHAILIAERIQNLGARPVEDAGMMGAIAQAFDSIKNLPEQKDTRFILHDAYEGEQKGIQMAEEIAKGDLDEESEKLIKNILKEDRKHIQTLEKLLN